MKIASTNGFLQLSFAVLRPKRPFVGGHIFIWHYCCSVILAGHFSIQGCLTFFNTRPSSQWGQNSWILIYLLFLTDKNEFVYWKSFTTSKTDCHLSRQKVGQRISVMKTNTGIFVVFTTKRELKCQLSGRNRVCLFSLLQFFEVINDDLLLKL